VGQWLAVGGPVVELLDLEELEVVLDVPERHFVSLKEASPARVSFEALPGIEMAGRISAVIPRAAAETRTFPVKVRFANRGHRVGVGMLAQVELGGGEGYTALVVPKDAVVRQGDGGLVYRIGGGNTVEPVTVATRGAVGAWIEVVGPLAAGDRVVTRGNERLFPGQPVAPTAVPYALP
jgi:RND family efflux transporter MFP subunit